MEQGTFKGDLENVEAISLGQQEHRLYTFKLGIQACGVCESLMSGQIPIIQLLGTDKSLVFSPVCVSTKQGILQLLSHSGLDLMVGAQYQFRLLNTTSFKLRPTEGPLVDETVSGAETVLLVAHNLSFLLFQAYIIPILAGVSYTQRRVIAVVNFHATPSTAVLQLVTQSAAALGLYLEQLIINIDSEPAPAQAKATWGVSFRRARSRSDDADNLRLSDLYEPQDSIKGLQYKDLDCALAELISKIGTAHILQVTPVWMMQLTQKYCAATITVQALPFLTGSSCVNQLYQVVDLQTTSVDSFAEVELFEGCFAVARYCMSKLYKSQVLSLQVPKRNGSLSLAALSYNTKAINQSTNTIQKEGLVSGETTF